jgi:hypothetical protein
MRSFATLPYRIWIERETLGYLETTAPGRAYGFPIALHPFLLESKDPDDSK